jgi:hypothetical protein
MSGTYPAYFEDGPLAGQLLDMMREEKGGPSAIIVTHHAPKLDLDPEAGRTAPDRVVYYLNRKGKLAGGAHDGLELYVYREGDDLPEHPEHQEPTA